MVAANNRNKKASRWFKQAIQENSANPIFESLETRQLLSCVIDTRLVGGGKAVNVTAVGQVVQMQVWAVITGSDATGSDDGFQSVPGSFLSTSASTGSILGNLSSAVVAPFDSSGAQNGEQADLDGDGDLDIGSNDPNNFPPFFNARAPEIVYSGGVVSGASQSFEIGTLSFTVTNLKAGQATDINFRERGDDSFTGGALWGEDGQFTDSDTGSFSLGAPVVVTDTSIQATTQSISGEVYKDTNSNGALNSGEPGLAGVVVYIDSNNDGVLDGSEQKATTDANGLYSFTGLTTGAYIVRQQVPTGFKQTAPSGGLGQHVSLTSGANASGINFGDAGSAITSVSQSISGEVYNDANSNGALNSGETGVSGVVVYIDSNNDGALDGSELQTTTDANGLYSFSNMGTGTFIVRQKIPTGFKQTAPSGGMGQHITLNSGTNATGVNFGDAGPATAAGQTISGEVYKDANDNGKLDSGETGVAGVTVYLDMNNDGKFDSGEPTTITDASGDYSFSVAPGGYIVRQTVPSGYKQSAPSGGLGQHVSVSSGKSVTGENFGDDPTTVVVGGSISGEVYIDSNGNGKLDSGETGLAGITVYLDLNNTGSLSTSDPQTVTNAAGDYTFANLAAGSYIVRQVDPSGYQQTAPTSGFGNHVTVGASSVVSGANFGDHPTATAKIAVASALFSDSEIQPVGSDLDTLDWATA